MDLLGRIGLSILTNGVLIIVGSALAVGGKNVVISKNWSQFG